VRLLEPFQFEGDHLAIDLPGARALFTTRRGGYSGGPYESLNLGRFTDDEPEAVERNRLTLERGLGVRFAYGRQVHGDRVVRAVDAPPAGAIPEEADGQATAVTGLAPMVLTADCLPIALAGGGAVAMLHAGWRGLAAGVVASGVAAVRELGDGGPVAAAIGPGAGPCCYEVSEDVHEAFADYGTSVRHGRTLDLKAIARAALQRSGVGTVHDAGLCTICSDPALFFSHRRDHGITGRQAGIAWLS
jgi:purine-nucleoside/S-methyl-5'-thioadenosine phosphorylase / adenosine deaminase